MSARNFFNRERLRITLRQTMILIVLPWAASLLTVRWGWTGGWPGRWNWPAIIVVGAGFSVFLWGLGMKLALARSGAGPFENQLQVSGPYAFTRNPMGLSVLAVWLGWALFYGSVGVFAGLVAIWAVLVFRVVPSEERELETRFGDDYRNYMKQVPRWFGRTTS